MDHVTLRRMALVVAAALLVPGCGGDKKKAAPKEKKTDEAKTEAPPEKKRKEFPKFEKSGVQDDVKKWQDLASAPKYAKTKEEKAAAQATLDAFLAEMATKWTSKTPPDQEAYQQALLLKAAGKTPEALAAVRRYVAIAEGTDSVNLASGYLTLVQLLCLSNEFDAAESALAAGERDIFEIKPDARLGATTTIAMALANNGHPERAARYFESAMTQGTGDPESALYGVECLLRAGNRDGALAFAKKAADAFKEGRSADRMRDLVAATELVGQPAAGRFAAVKHWKGLGAAITDADFAGKVTVVCGWKIDAKWAEPFFKQVNKMKADYDGKGVQWVGISRLCQFDPAEGGTKKDMTEETELEFYDAFQRHWSWDYPMAVGAIDSPALMEAWGAHATPSLTVVGKDGTIVYTRTGHQPEHVATVRTILDREIAK